MAKIYMYLPKGQKLEDQMKEYGGNAIYYSKSAVLETVKYHTKNANATINELKDRLLAIEPVKDKYKDQYMSIKKEIASIKVHKITDYVELDVQVVGIGRLQKPVKVKSPKEMN